MITDSQTNKLFLSPLLEKVYPLFYQKFFQTLQSCGIDPGFLEGTKDVWCVDFMPIQLSQNRFVQFKFSPKYLKPKKYHKTISDPEIICDLIGLKPMVSDLIIDGGNVVKSDNKVILTTRVIEENPQYSVKQLTEKIRNLLEVEQVILIPQQPQDFTGHSDGMVRFYDTNTILINDYSKEADKEFVRSLYAAVHNAGLDLIEIPTSIFYNQSYDDATGAYINYLQMEGHIFLPTFRRAEDEHVIRIFEDLFQGIKIIPVESTQLSRAGGILNCISWNINA